MWDIDLKPFFGLRTDGSQARKTGDDKEMVLLKTDYKGLYDFLYESQDAVYTALVYLWLCLIQTNIPVIFNMFENKNMINNIYRSIDLN